jgi:hypothetical protein
MTTLTWVNGIINIIIIQIIYTGLFCILFVCVLYLFFTLANFLIGIWAVKLVSK